MFSINRWAALFLSVCADYSDSAFSCLKLIVQPVKSAHRVFSGYSDAKKLEKIIRECIKEAGITEDPALEYSIRYLCMLIKKKYLQHIDFLFDRIEQKLNEQKGILNLTLETASAPGAYEEGLARMIGEKTGAADFKIKTITRPELLGGYLLRMGNFYIDASLKGQIEKMKSELRLTALASADKAFVNGGINV